MTESGICQRCRGDQKGFTLVEVLVAFIIVGLSLTVFLQLLSGSMRLSHKSRHLLDQAIHADEVFSQILLQDIRTEDFLWHDEEEDGRWELQLEAIEVVDPEVDKTELTIVPVAELYQLVLTFYVANDRPTITLKSVRQYPLTYFTEEFKQLHLQSIEVQEML